MNKIRVFTFLFLIISLNIFAFEAGGVIKTGLGIDLGKNKANLSHFDSLSLWAKQNLDKEGNYNFAIQSSYLFNLKKPIKPEDKVNIMHIANLDMLKFSFLIPLGNNSLSIDMGRYNISDITAVILNQNIDGVYISYTMPRFSAFFNLGYTGLLNAYANTINAPDVKPIIEKDIKVYKLAPSFAHISALFKLPFASMRHTFDLDLNSFIATGNPKTTNNYASISVNGPIVKNLFYLTSISTSMLTRENKKVPQIGFFVLGELDYYFKKYSSKLGLKTQFFSGGKMSFESFTLANMSKVNFMKSRDLFKISLDGSIKPVKDLFLSTEAGIMAYAATQPNGRSNFAGFEWDVSANYTIRQDISIITDLGMFMGKNGKFDAVFKLKGCISF